MDTPDGGSIMQMTRDKIIEAVQGTNDLPSFPDVVLKLQEEFRKSEPSIARVGQIVEQDPAISARFLKVANSAYYSRTQKISSIQNAVTRLGLEEARLLALATGLVSQFGDFGGGDPQRFWGHSLAVALSVRIMSELSSKAISESVADSAFTGGLLHDLGVLILFHLFPEPYGELTKIVMEKGGTPGDVEREQWGTDHGEVGEILALRWKLPESICQAIRYHHCPWEAAPKHRSLVQLVHLSDFVCNNQGFGRTESGFPEEFDQGAWDALGLDLNQVPEIIEQVRQEGQRSEVFMEAFG
jgi:HD-like signal output (HDOD) protein